MDESRKKSFEYLHVLIVVLLMFMFGFIPAPAPITAYGMQILGIFIGLVYGWTFCGLAWPSILALIALGLTEYGITETVLSSVYGQANLILMIFGFMVFAPLGESGLTEYLGNKLLSIKFMQGRPLVMIATIYAGVFLIALTGINGYLLMFFLMGIFIDMFKGLGYQKGDRFIPMFLCGMFIQTAFANLFLPFMPFPVMVFGAAGVAVNGIRYMLFSLIFILFLDMALITLFKIFHLNLKPLQDIDYGEIREKTRQPLSNYQKALLMIVIMFIVLMFIVGIFSAVDGNGLQRILAKIGIYGVIAFVLVVMMIVKIEGKQLLTMETLATGVNWNIVFLYSMALTMSNVLTSADTGISTFVVGITAPILATLSEYWFLLLLGVITLLLTNIGNNVVVIFTMITVIKMMLGANLPINGVLAVAVVLYSGLSTGYLLPAASVSASLIFGCDLCTPKTALLQGVTVILLWILMMALVMIPAGMIIL